MARIIITHVGTSALTCEAFTQSPDAPENLTSLVRNLKGRELKSDEQALLSHALGSGLNKVFLDPRRVTKLELRQAAPAEIASLHILDLKAGDRIVLVCSDTFRGRNCGELLRRTLAGNERNAFFPQGLTVPERIDPLLGVSAPSEKTNANQFVDQGLPAYMELVAREYRIMMESHSQVNGPVYDSLIFNITGGYKGVIPFAVLASQLLNSYPKRIGMTEVVYYHEEGNHAIALTPRLPVDWRQDEGIPALARTIRARLKLSGRSAPEDPFDHMILLLLDELRW
jgi:hypothetical protein